MIPLDDRLPTLGDLYTCDGCDVALCCHPAGACPFPPFHIRDKGRGYLEVCGDFVYQGKCPNCEIGVCRNQAAR